MAPVEHGTKVLLLAAAASLWARTAAADDGGPAPAPVVLSASSPRSLVHLVTDRPARLESLDPITFQWSAACDAPCDRLLPNELRYRIAGDDLLTSDPIQLVAAPGQPITLRARTASSGPRATGQGMLIAGAVTGAVGGVLMIGGFFAALSAGGIDGSGSSSSATAAGDVAIAGFVILGVGGLTALAGGVVWLAGSRPTTVEQVARLPQWRPATPESVAMPRATGAPVWSVRF
jgi:hypothetical protein